MKIQQINQHHIPGILYLCNICMPEEGFLDPTVFSSWFPDMVIGFCVRTRKKREIVAFLFGVRLPSAFYIMAVGVHPNLKRKGLGKRLVEHFLCSLPEDLPVWCKIHRRNDASLGLFKKLGFRKEAKKNTPKGLKKSMGAPYDPFRYQKKKGSVELKDFDFPLESQKLSDRIKSL